ncbi:MAG: PVC-type heme-binding CxxCH protein, partial [Gemmatimonadota bacterium]
QHFDAAIVAWPAGQINAAAQRLLDQFKASGHGVQTVTSPPSDQQIRSSLPTLVSRAAMSQYQAFLASRAAVRYEKKIGVANYERRIEDLPVPDVLPARESMKHIQVPGDFEIQLFASEPEIGRPIAMAWDERGRLWIAEAHDYPHQLMLDIPGTDGKPTGEGNDRIVICEDTNGDGRADKFTVFADKLNMATSLVFANGGIIVSALQQFVFLKDTNGDDKADVRTPLFYMNWSAYDTHAMSNNLSRGFDNWLYGAVGNGGFGGVVGGVYTAFGTGVYRFRPDGSAMQNVGSFTNNTWGIGFNSAGDLFGSTANNQPSFYVGIPAYAAPALGAPTGPVPVAPNSPPGRGGRGGAQGFMSAKPLAPGLRIHPNTPNVRQADVQAGYTAAANHRFMESDALPERLRGNALVAEPSAKLISIMRITPSGSGYAAEDGLNFLASTDEWMSPVYADVGPDGAIWVADFQNFIVQHNPTPQNFPSTATFGLAHTSPLRTNQYGRIYRVVWKDGAATPIKSLAGASTAAIVAALDSGNLFWRQTAQRLIVDGRKMDAVPALKTMVKDKAGRPGAIHALWALQGLGALDRDLHHWALLSKDAPLRRNAVRALESNEAGSRLFFETGVVNDPDMGTRLAAFVKLAQFPTTPAIKTVVAQLRKDPKNAADEWLGSANAGVMLVRAHNVADAELDAVVTLRPGDPTAGEAIFRTNTTAACLACHSLGGSGGVVGPALDGIGASRDEAYIRESVITPNAKLATGFESLVVSPMPPMPLLLKPQEIEDVVSFLLTLRTTR